MRFIIENGLPFLIGGGKAYPVNIHDGKVDFDEDGATLTNATGNYTLDEIVRKLGDVSSIKPKKKKSKEKED